jgi:Na+/H+-dicarboxylate symporter
MHFFFKVWRFQGLIALNRFFSRFSAIFINLLTYEREQAHVFILVAMVLGVLTGYIVHENSSPGSIKSFQQYKVTYHHFHQVGANDHCATGFTTLVVGIAKLGDLNQLEEWVAKQCFGLFRIT